MLTRRRLFQLLLAAPLAKWLPTRGLPRPDTFYRNAPLRLDEITAVTRAQFIPAIRDDFFKADPLLAYLRTHQSMTFMGSHAAETAYAPLLDSTAHFDDDFEDEDEV